MTGESSSPSLLLHTTTSFVAFLLLLQVGWAASTDTGCEDLDNTPREDLLATGWVGLFVGNVLVEDTGWKGLLPGEALLLLGEHTSSLSSVDCR